MTARSRRGLHPVACKWCNNKHPRNQQRDCPSPEEIQRRARRIRQTWGTRERNSRSSWASPHHWRPPELDTPAQQPLQPNEG